MKEQADQFGAGDINNSFSNSNNNVLQQQQYVHHLQHHNSKDVNHSSDTEDCDLELGSGRLVIDLEAESSTTSSSTTATTTTINSIEDGKSLKSEDTQQLFSNNSKKSCNNNNGGFSKKSNNGNNNNIMKMSHSFSEVSNNSSSNRGRVSYSISSVPGNNGSGGTGYSTSPQVSYSTVSMTAQEQAANPAQQNKCIKMKIKRNTVAQGSHTPLSATSHLSATLHQPHSQNSPPPPPSSSSSSSVSLNSSLAPTTASVMPSSVSPPTLATSNGYQAKTAIMENSVFTYKIQRSSTNNCMTSVNSVTCKNVPLGSLPLSTSSTTEGTRGLNQHHHHHQGGTSYLSEGCQTTPYPSSGGMPTRSAKQPNNKRSKQSHNHSNTTGMYAANTNNNKTQNFPTTSTQQQHDQITTHSSSPYQNNNNSKQSSLTNTPYSGMPHHPPFGYDPSAPKYPSRGSHKSSSAALLNGRDKAVTTPGDPYDFNCTGEDVGGVILKKLKNEKCERACSPITALRRDVEVEACHVGVITDPDCLGPCEPGTSVTLEGIVWNETENGLLVVNVTWRGKTYVGTLMDATRHHWAPPRFTGESPTSDLDGRAQKGRGKRGRNNPVAPPPPVRPDNGSDRKLRSNRNNGNSSKQLQTAPSPVRSNGGMGGDFGLKKNRSDQSNDSMNSSYSNNICRKTSTRSESRMSYSESSTNDDCATSCNSTYSSSTSIMIECPEENCNKKYRNSVGLKYHQTRCHQSKTVTPTTSTAPTSSGSATTAETPILVEGKSQSLKESKQEAQERNSTSSEDGDTSSSSSSSSHSSVAQKHKSTMRSGQLESSKQTSMDNAKVPPRQEDPAVTTGVPLTNSFPVTSLMSSAQIVNNSPTTASSFVGCTSSDKTSTSTCTESSAVVTLNGSMSETNKIGVENEATPEITTKTPMNNNNVNNNNNNSNINNNNNNIVINNNNNNNNATCNTSTNELKLHSISTMTHQTTETCPSERTGKRKKRERHLAIDRNNDTNSNAAASDGCCAPSAKNPKLENDGKENSADKLSAGQQVGSFSSVSSAMASSAPVSTMPVSSMTGNLYAGTIDRPIYISTSTDDCLTSFNPSPSIVPASTSTSTVIRSTSGLSSTSIYDGVRDSPRETSSAISATSENGIIYSTLSVGSNHLETPKQSTDKRHSPLTMGDYPCHGSGVVPMDLNNSEFTHSKRLRLSPTDDNNKNNAISQQHQKHTSSDLNMIPQDAPSPAYSDISDANENAPMLEKEANQTSMSTEDEVSVLRCLSSEGPSTPHGGPKQQDSFVCSPFYGLMPQLTPVVSSPVVVNREFTNKFSLVGSNPSVQYGSEDAPSADKISPSTLESQKNENVKFGDSSSSTSSSSSSKKHDFCQSSQRTSSGQHMSDSLRKTPSTSIMSGEVNPNQVHLLSVPPMSALGFPQTLFSGAFNFGDREVRAHWERFMEMQQKQYHDVELHKQDQEAKYRAENSSLKPLVDERYKHAPILPAPPSLISDYSKFKPKEDYPTALNPTLWDGSKSQSRDIPDLRGAPTPDHHGSSKTSEKFDRRYLPPPPPHILEQPFQHSHQSSKAGAGDGGKPSAVVAPQTREKIGNVGQLPKGSYDAGNRENRSSQQHPKYSNSAGNNSATNSSYSGSYSVKNSRDGRQQLKEDNSSAPHKREENVMKSSSSSISSSKTKLRSGSSDAASSQQPTGLQLPPSPSPMPAPYPPPPSFYPPFLTPGAPYMPSPFDPAFLSTMNPIAAMLQQPPYGIHPSQILHPAAAAPGSLNMNTPDPKSQAPGHQHHRTCLDFDSGSAHHKIHELKEVAKGETSSGNPGSSLENRPLSSGGMQHSSVIQSGGSSSAGRDVVKDKDTSSEPALQRHLHTHHHMHVIGPYAYMNSESAMLASQPNNSSGVSPQLPRPSYLGK